MMNNNDLGERYPFNVINCIFGTHNCFPKDAETAEKLIKNQEFWIDYEKVLNSIDDECKDVAVKHFKEGKSLEEISKEINVDFETADSLLTKALRQLRHPNRAKFLKKYIYRGIHMINFNISSLTASQEEKIAKGIEKYLAIKKLFDSGISLNDTTNANTVEFQKLFNSFYRVRRNEKWRKVFYDLFDGLKANKSVQFDAAFNEFTKRLQACNMNSAEKSFVSKMVHTINNDSPIIDGNVLKGLHIKGNDAVKIYSDLREIYTNELLPNAEAKGFFADFDKKFPNGADISKVKKIDFYLWALFAK